MARPRKEKLVVKDDLYYESEKSRNREALKSIRLFFVDKKLYEGEKVIKTNLYSDSSVQVVRAYARPNGFNRCFDYADKHILPFLVAPPEWRNQIPWPVKFTILVMNDAGNRGVPIEHRPGIMLLYFHYCKGFDLPDLNSISA